MFIQLTTQHNGPVLVNPSNITIVVANDGGSELHFNNGDAVRVTEDLNTVIRVIANANRIG